MLARQTLRCTRLEIPYPSPSVGIFDSKLIILAMQGRYNYYECGLEISDARAEDQGEWSCEIESYVKNGQRGDGYMSTVIILLTSSLYLETCQCFNLYFLLMNHFCDRTRTLNF